MCDKEQKESLPETFPQPRTFPKNWHFSRLMAEDKDDDAQEEADDWKPETFPQPRTIPKNWHVEDKE